MLAAVWRGFPGGPDGIDEAGGTRRARKLITHKTVYRRLPRFGGAVLEGQMALVRLEEREKARTLMKDTVSRWLPRSGGACLEGQMALVQLEEWEVHEAW